MNRIWKMSLIITFLIILDQITKGVVQSKFYLGESIPIIDGFFNFTYVRNPGAAFGFMAHASLVVRQILFLWVPVGACVWLITLIWKTRNNNFIGCLAYSLIFAGAVGNLMDRFSMGYVVDFLDFYWGRSHFPAFNVADSAISVGAFFMIIDMIKDYKNKASNKVGSN
jgi:signal peptidase II